MKKLSRVMGSLLLVGALLTGRSAGAADGLVVRVAVAANFTAAIKHIAAGFERVDSPATRLSKLETMLERQATQGEHTIGLLANLLSLSPSPRCTNDLIEAPCMPRISAICASTPGRSSTSMCR